MTTVYELSVPQHTAGIDFLRVGQISLHRWTFDYGSGNYQDGVALTDGRDTIIVKVHDLFHLGHALLAEEERIRKSQEGAK